MITRTALALAALTALAVLHEATAVPKSRFAKDINVEKAEEDWKDYEDDEWHEDTFEWKKKVKAARAGNLDVDKLAAMAKGGGGAAAMQDAYLSHAAKSGDMHMSFVTLKKGVCPTQKCAEELGSRWRDLLKTDGLAVGLYPLSETELLYTEEEGRVIEARDFLLQQPEVEKFRWKDKDFTPDSLQKKQQAEEVARRESLERKAKRAAKKKAKAAAKAAAAAAATEL